VGTFLPGTFFVRNLFLSGTFIIQEPFFIGALFSWECLLSRNYFPGTFRHREPFSQERYFQERFGGNFLAGTLRAMPNKEHKMLKSEKIYWLDN
jgi:hypothetical protein